MLTRMHKKSCNDASAPSDTLIEVLVRTFRHIYSDYGRSSDFDDLGLSAFGVSEWLNIRLRACGACFDLMCMRCVCDLMGLSESVFGWLNRLACTWTIYVRVIVGG